MQAKCSRNRKHAPKKQRQNIAHVLQACGNEGFKLSGSVGDFGNYSDLLAAFFIFGKFVMECDSSNAICRVSSSSEDPWKFHFLLVEIKSLSSLAQVTFKPKKRGINLMADSVANHEVDREVFLAAPSL